MYVLEYIYRLYCTQEVKLHTSSYIIVIKKGAGIAWKLCLVSPQKPVKHFGTGFVFLIKKSSVSKRLDNIF